MEALTLQAWVLVCLELCHMLCDSPESSGWWPQPRKRLTAAFRTPWHVSVIFCWPEWRPKSSCWRSWWRWMGKLEIARRHMGMVQHGLIIHQAWIHYPPLYVVNGHHYPWHPLTMKHQPINFISAYGLIVLICPLNLQTKEHSSVDIHIPWLRLYDVSLCVCIYIYISC